MTILETDRLILRHLRLEDIDDLLSLYASSQFTRFLDRMNSRDKAQEWIEAFCQEYDTLGYGFYATIHKPDARFIGRCGLLTQWIDGMKEVEVAYGIMPEYWGRGLATEAAQALIEYGFRQFAFPRLISIIDRENVASQRVAEKAGMRREREFTHEGHACYLYVADR